MSQFNVHAQFKQDGSVTVTKGGLYSRKQNFKTTEAFQKDATKKLDAWETHYKRNAEFTKQGRLTQIEAEFYKGMIRDNEPNALKMIGKKLNQEINLNNMRAAAAQDMKERLNFTINSRKKVTKRR